MSFLAHGRVSAAARAVLAWLCWEEDASIIGRNNGRIITAH
jgi:hypothetical protein